MYLFRVNFKLKKKNRRKFEQKFKEDSQDVWGIVKEIRKI